MAAARRAGNLVFRLKDCLLESRLGCVACVREGDAAIPWQPRVGDLAAGFHSSAAPLVISGGGSPKLYHHDSARKNSDFVRFASGKTSHAASAKAAAEAAEIREEVQKVKEESKIHAGVKKVNETPSEETKIHEGVKKLKEDSSSDENAKKEARASAREEDEEAAEEVIDEKTKTLRAALAHVPKLGWTEAAMVAGAKDVGLSPAIVGAFQRKEAALVEFFMEECNLALAEELEDREEELAKMVLHDRVAAIVWMRLEMQIPYLSKWAQALSIQANPLNVPATVKQRALLVDDIWHAAGDRSADMDWYAKRALLAGVYSTTELYMLTDTSPGFRDTKTFLGRRIVDAIDCRKSVQEATHLAQALGAGFQNTVNAFLSRSRSPSGFKF
ncbi:ubiquinone biosynthesis protein COQ9 [Marchantia polymorpha subsp. ruderalis]|uniref:Ubiquinone biosynthesis protein n=2 Tax=Marchantia polymorpha TaxID=3197 RepID=A0A176WBJ1_MARPO|nr:hypothetical protein AXG93_4003s1160 [Marchantia polymorpha subsp. ruderalis]PTQ45020.1 hypothetical protein MARPO_0016s0081 [Marchantia polymorpha]BBN14285.1 hypothetical protein Mp_6g10390 [Marchantia polymorpha subsp. ruderalis]|eukprot:PTQ45020.1 hypothetical protein MARPO_0016s0081 [Marchantia polymorpha]